jgi:hypothetical protein
MNHYSVFILPLRHLVFLLAVEEIQDCFSTREGKIGVRLFNLRVRDGKFGLEVSICSTHPKILDDVVLEY